MASKDVTDAIDRAIASLGSQGPPVPTPLGWGQGQTITLALIPELSGIGHEVLSPDPDRYSKWQFLSRPIWDPTGAIVGYNNWVSKA